MFIDLGNQIVIISKSLGGKSQKTVSFLERNDPRYSFSIVVIDRFDSSCSIAAYGLMSAKCAVSQWHGM